MASTTLRKEVSLIVIACSSKQEVWSTLTKNCTVPCPLGVSTSSEVLLSRLNHAFPVAQQFGGTSPLCDSTSVERIRCSEQLSAKRFPVFGSCCFYHLSLCGTGKIGGHETLSCPGWQSSHALSVSVRSRSVGQGSGQVIGFLRCWRITIAGGVELAFHPPGTKRKYRKISLGKALSCCL